jgi:hypothetical protein
MRPDELSALAAFDLLEMMFKSGVISAPCAYRIRFSAMSDLGQVSDLRIVQTNSRFARKSRR